MVEDDAQEGGGEEEVGPLRSHDSCWMVKTLFGGELSLDCLCQARLNPQSVSLFYHKTILGILPLYKYMYLGSVHALGAGKEAWTISSTVKLRLELTP